MKNTLTTLSKPESICRWNAELLHVGGTKKTEGSRPRACCRPACQYKGERERRSYAVHEYVIANRDNPRLGEIPERILDRFGEHLGKARGVIAA